MDQVVLKPDDKKEDVQKEDHPDNLKKNETFSDEDLNNAWNAFKEERREMGNDQEVALLNHDYRRSENIIQLQIHNPILEITFDKLKVDLMAHLRKLLQNGNIRVELEKLETESKKMIYTNKEKFEHLATIYPTVKLLQEKLGLDPDY